MKTKLLFLVVALLCISNSNSQTPTVTDNTSKVIKLAFYSVNKSDGSNSTPLSTVIAAYDKLNEDYNPHNIYFKWDKTTVGQINNDTYYNNTDKNKDKDIFSELEQNSKNGKIVIYLFNRSRNFGLSDGIDSGAELLVSGNLITTQTISHEMGHVLSLYHLFETQFGIEEVNGNSYNRTNTGDKVSDTPAAFYSLDPTVSVPLLDQSNGGCSWIYEGGNTVIKDPNNDSYDTDASMIMGYASCADHFTRGQADRMRNALATSSHLTSVKDTSTDVYEIVLGQSQCINAIESISVVNTFGFEDFKVTWDTSDNVEIVSTTNNGKNANIKITNSSSNWIKATISIDLTASNNDPINYPDLATVKVDNIPVLTTPDVSSGEIRVHPQHNDEMPGPPYKNEWTRMWVYNYSQSYSDWEWNVNYSYLRGNNGTSQIEIKPYTTGYITVKARRSNACGPSAWVSKDFYITENSGSGGGGGNGEGEEDDHEKK